MPSTNPPIEHPSGLAFAQNRAAQHLVALEVAGCISAGRQGKELAELYDMYQAGARVYRRSATGWRYRVDDPSTRLRAQQRLRLMGVRRCFQRRIAWAGQRRRTGNAFRHESKCPPSPKR